MSDSGDTMRPRGFAIVIVSRRGSSLLETGVAGEDFDQIGDGNTEDRAGEAVLEAGHESRDVAAQRHAVQSDCRLRLLRPDPRHARRRMSHTA